MKARLTRRQRKIFRALFNLGGEATTREIAGAVGMNVNGVSQTLGTLTHVECLGGKGGDCRWKMV